MSDATSVDDLIAEIVRVKDQIQEGKDERMAADSSAERREYTDIIEALRDELADLQEEWFYVLKGRHATSAARRRDHDRAWRMSGMCESRCHDRTPRGTRARDDLQRSGPP
jgi:hypothetical protein